MISVRTVTVVDPTAEDTVERYALAPRLRSLEGASVGLIDNSKRRADAFLEELRALLRGRYGVTGFEYYRKSSPSVPAPSEVLARFAETCDAVVHAVAD